MQKVNTVPVEKFFISPVNVQPTLQNIKNLQNVHSAIARNENGFTKLLIVSDFANRTLANVILCIDTSLYKICKTKTDAATITIELKSRKELQKPLKPNHD